MREWRTSCTRVRNWGGLLYYVILGTVNMLWIILWERVEQWKGR